MFFIEKIRKFPEILVFFEKFETLQCEKLRNAVHGGTFPTGLPATVGRDTWHRVEEPGDTLEFKKYFGSAKVFCEKPPGWEMLTDVNRC